MADALSPSKAVEAGDALRLRVRALAAGGAGVADLADGRVVFVHRTAPGDEVEARLSRLRPRWGTATLERVLHPGPARVPPPCPRYEACGSCTLQHIDYDEQRAWKGRFVAEALRRIGGLEIEPPPVEPSPQEWEYRNRVTFTLRRLPGGRVVAGYHRLDRPGYIVDVGNECLLIEPPIRQAWAELRRVWGPKAARLPAGRELRITLRTTDDGVVVLVRGGRNGWTGDGLLDDLPSTTALWHQPTPAEPPRRLSGPATFETWGDERFPLGGGAFVQVNRHAAGLLTAHVLDAVGPAATVVDAYCGAGIYGRALARAGLRTVGVELDPEACAAARHEAPQGFQVVEGRVEDRLADLLPADTVILNPPRTGLADPVPPLLVSRPSRRLVYVSCDAATLARDAARLAAGYRLASVRAFDLFPQTAHVESVAVFEER